MTNDAISSVAVSAVFGYLLLVYTLSGEARLGALLVAGVVLLRGLQILAGRW